MTSKLRIDEIVDSTDTGSPAFPLGVTTTALSYTGTLTGSTGVLNIGSGQVYKDSSGNVGIGTSSPDALFNVHQSATSGTDSFIGSFTTQNGGLFRIGCSDLSQANPVWQIRTGGSEPIAFNQASDERMRINSNGSFLVGTTSNFSVNSASNGFYVGQSGVIVAAVNNQVTLYAGRNGSDGSVAAFRRQGTLVGNISVTASSTSYNTSSDYRLKNFIAPVTDSGARIDALEPVEFEWLADGKPARGFFAHKFQEVYPDSVTGQKDEVDKDGNPVHQAMQAGSSEVIADLVAEIQSLRARVAQLEGN